MVKALVLRCLQVFAIVFALSCLATVAMEASEVSSSMLTSVTAPAKTSVGKAVAAGLPDVAIETAGGTRTSFAATGGRVLDRVSDEADTTEFVAAARRALDQQ
jgi:hypothetical protein